MGRDGYPRQTEVIEVGPNGEKVDVMTFRGSFERDVTEFAEEDRNMKAAIDEEDDDAVETHHERAVLSSAARCTIRPTS